MMRGLAVELRPGPVGVFLVNYLGQKVALQGDAMTDVCTAILTVHFLCVAFQLLQT